MGRVARVRIGGMMIHKWLNYTEIFFIFQNILKLVQGKKFDRLTVGFGSKFKIWEVTGGAPIQQSVNPLAIKEK